MRILLTALLLLQGMPVTRLAGGAAAQGPGGQPSQSARSGLPVTQLDTVGPAASLDAPARLSLTFSEPRPIEEVLHLLIAGTTFSLALDPDVTGMFRGELRQLTLRDALATLLSPLGCDYEVRGTVMRITRHRTQTREFDVNLLAVERGLARAVGPSEALVKTTVAAEDGFASLADGVQALLSSSGHVHVDRRAGVVQVTDYPERLDRVAQYLESVQLGRTRQVHLQARVLEVTLKNAPLIDWSAVRSRLGLAKDAPDAGIAVDPAAVQAALAEQGDVRVLSTPDVTTLNNEPALVRAAMTGLWSMTLTIVPQIASDGMLQLSVSHAWQEQQETERAARVAEADTVTRVMDGHTVMLSGWLRPPEATAARGTSSELVVLLRATVVTPGTR